MKLKLEHIIIIGLFLGILYLSNCSGDKGGKSTIVTERYTDTIVRVDTFINEIVRNHTNLTPIGHETTYVYSNTFIDKDTFNFVVKDSLLEARITAFSETRPIIDFNYLLKNYEIKTNTIIKDSVYTKEFKSYLAFGGTILGNKNNFGFAPKIDYIHKKGNTYSLGYDVINNNIQIGFSKKISFR